MQALLRYGATFGSRALTALAETNLAQHPAAASSALSSAPCTASLLDLMLLTSATRLQARSVSSSATVDATSLAPSPSSADSLPAAAPTPAAALHLSSSRIADPGEPRYTAPYWIPEDVRTAHRLPAVLFSDPWTPHDEHALRRLHAQALLDHLRLAGRPLTLDQVFEGVNRDLAAAGPKAGAPPPLATPSYAKQLLEHLRRNRMVYGIKNPVSALSSGHPKHPRLYAYLPFQAARLGHPAALAKQDAEEREAAVQQALRRLRRSKPPYAIHRRRARFSVWQHLQAQEALQQLREGPALLAE